MKNKRIALVTGANKGIGFEVARGLARMGVRVFLGARNEEAGRAAVAKITDGEVTFLRLDVADPESIRRAGIVWLAAEAPQDFTGNFVRDRKIIPW